MAKKSVIARNKVRLQKVAAQFEKRKAIKDELLNDPMNHELQHKLSKTRNASHVRVRNRCRFCGRPRGTYRKFGICRICLRQLLNKGLIPGLRKASW